MLSTRSDTNISDIHRPLYHFLPAANWMNDPNGVIQWRGRYHLFFQYNPDGAYHANMHWGHAVSDDLIHWRELPIALAPSPDSPDQGGVFSGSIVDNDGVPAALYTGVNDDYSVQLQCLALGNEDLSQWQKYPGNPVIGEVPATLGQTRDFRDPFVWRHRGSWYLALAARIVGVGGAVLLYRSENLTDWHYLHPLYVGERGRNGYNFECPSFFQLGDKWVLIVSAQWEGATDQTLYFVGTWEDGRFVPEVEGVYDAGYSYASLCHQDESGRQLIYSWIREARSGAQQVAAGWSGLQAIPRVLWLDSRNRLCSAPVPEFEALRRAHHRFSASDLGDDLLPIGGRALDIEAEFDVERGSCCGIEVLATPDGGEGLRVLYDANTQTLRVQRRYRVDDPAIDCRPQGMPHSLDPGERLQLRLLLDGSVLELIANGRSRLTSRFYPTDADSGSLRVLNREAVRCLDIWELSSIW